MEVPLKNSVILSEGERLISFNQSALAEPESKDLASSPQTFLLREKSFNTREGKPKWLDVNIFLR